MWYCINNILGCMAVNYLDFLNNKTFKNMQFSINSAFTEGSPCLNEVTLHTTKLCHKLFPRSSIMANFSRRDEDTHYQEGHYSPKSPMHYIGMMLCWCHHMAGFTVVDRHTRTGENRRHNSKVIKLFWKNNFHTNRACLHQVRWI